MKKTPSPKSGFVYAFFNPAFPGWIKIGMSKNWQKRLEVCQTYAPLDFEPVAVLKTADMAKVEKILHGALSMREQQSKEFFFMTREQVLDAMSHAASLTGEITGLTTYADGTPDAVYNAKGRPVSARSGAKLRGVKFRAVKGGSSVYMTFRNGEYVVLKGSALCPMTESLRMSDIKPIASIRADRESIEHDPARCRGGKLIVDIPFKSSSRALAVMLGTSAAQGPVGWVDEEERPLADYL